VVVNGVPAAPVVAGSVPVTYCEGATAAALTATGTDLLWYTAATGGVGVTAAPVPSTAVVGMQSWYVSQTNGCESPRAEVDVVVTVGSDCQLGYYVPNAFSPNGDGNNDVFRVRTSDSPKSFRMLVFNRFGGKVFESSTIREGWNGMAGGSLLTTGTYVYVIAITTSAGVVIDRKGTVELVH
jgi:gliding motility-associated-like protein